MHELAWFISLGQQVDAFLDSALHLIKITWFSYVFADIWRVPVKVVCRMQLNRPSELVVSLDILKFF